MGTTNQPSLSLFRKKAEEILKTRLSATGEPKTIEDIQRLLYEIQLNKIELELWNNELIHTGNTDLASKSKKINVLKLIDFEKVNTLLEGFNQSTGFVTAILDLEGNVLSKSGWRQICTQYHRINPETSEKCTISDTVLSKKLAEDERYHFYECLNGLVDVAVPIVIKGEHIANLFSGQFFFEQPNIQFFRKQAERHNFDLDEYLKALEKVPVVSKEKVKIAMDFLLDMTQLISEITLQKLEQMQMNDSIVKNEERLRSVLDNLLEGCQIIGFDWTYIYLNRCAEIHNRRPNQELLGQRYQDMWPGIEETEVFKIIKRTLEERTSVHFENKFYFPDGSPGWFDLSIQPVPEGVFILSIDITERKLKEEQLYESEVRFSKLYEEGPFGMAMVDASFRFKKVNRTYAAIMGYSEKELQGMTFEDITFPEDVPVDLPNVRKLINKEIAVYKTEKRYIRKDGKIIWGSLTVIANFTDDGRFLYNLAIVEDITHRKQAEKDLRERENKLSTILNLLPVGISILDQDQKIVYENPALENMLGITMEGLRRGDHRGRKYLRSDGTPKPVEEFASSRVFSEKKAQHNIVTGIVKEDGNTVWTNVSAVPVDFPDWKVVLVTADVTGIKHTEEALQKSKQLLSETESMGKVGGWEFNIDTLQQTWTDEVYRIHEVDLDFKHDVDKGINFYTPESRPIIEKAVQRVLESGDPFDLELEIITSKGNLRKVHTIGKADFENRRVYGFFQDITERKLAEEEIIRLNERISTATRASQVGIWDWNVKDNILTWDDQMYALYGVKKEEFAGAYEAWINGLHPDDREFGTRQTQLALSGEKEYDTEFRVIRPDGTIRYCKARGEVFRNEKGEPVRMVGINYDVTQQKLIEKELQESEEYLRLGYDTANLGIWKNDLNTMIVEFDERARSHYGFEESVVTLSDVINRIHPDDMGRLVAEIEKATAPSGSGRYSTEYRVIHPDGSVHWLYIGVRVTFDGEGENRRSVMGFGTSLDITERKRAEEALRESEEKFRNLIESLPLPVTYVNREGEIVFRNDRFLQVMGYSRKEVPTVNEWWRKAYPNEKYRKQVVQQWEMAVENARANDTDIEPTEYKTTCKDGIERTMIVSGIIIEDNILITFIDITDRKKAEEEVIKLNETLEERVEERTAQLREANQELEAFSYSVSHDLRAPLRHINGFVDLLTENYAAAIPEKGRHYLNVIVNSSRHMGTLIDDLLQFSRTGRQEMQQTRLDMNLVLNEVMKLLTPEIKDRKIEWHLESLPAVKGDHALLRMVLYNLVSNAVKFTKAKELATILVGFTDSEREYTFFVRDNGAGFDMRYVHKLFGVFQRLHTTKDFEGTGIGLANVRRIILRHGGRVWAESQLYEGATFYFTLPKHKETEK